MRTGDQAQGLKIVCAVEADLVAVVESLTTGAATTITAIVVVMAMGVFEAAVEEVGEVLVPLPVREATRVWMMWEPEALADIKEEIRATTNMCPSAAQATRQLSLHLVVVMALAMVA